MMGGALPSRRSAHWCPPSSIPAPQGVTTQMFLRLLPSITLQNCVRWDLPKTSSYQMQPKKKMRVRPSFAEIVGVLRENGIRGRIPDDPDASTGNITDGVLMLSTPSWT